MERAADVAIIGGGPAGSTLAALLAGKGLDVALIDRDAFPRDKVCGEFLSYDALPVLERIGVIDAIDRAGSPRIERCRINARTQSFEFAFPRPARGISRMVLDDLLFRTAVAAGAHAYPACPAVAIDPETRTVMLEDRRGADPEPSRITLRARVLVGAWGRWGRFDNELRRPFANDKSHRNFGFKRHYKPNEPTDGIIDLYSFGRGYLGVSGIEGGLTNICGLVHASRLAGHKGRWDSFVESIRQEEAPLESMFARHVPAQESFLSSDPLIFRGRSPVERGIIMIGDASGVVDPLTGNGMAMAIQSALLAAPYVLRIARRDSTAVDAYRQAHSEFFGPRIRWSRRVARILSRPALLDAGIRTPGQTKIGEFLLGHTRANADSLSRLADEWF